jgi:transposase
MTIKSQGTTMGADAVQQLEQWGKAHGTPQQVVLRSRIGLAAAAGQSDLHIAAALGVNRHTVRLWRHRIAQDGIGTVWEVAGGRGRKAQYGSRTRDRIVRATLHERPPARRTGVAARWPPPRG